jgi:hypothetical protein
MLPSVYKEGVCVSVVQLRPTVWNLHWQAESQISILRL